MSNYSEPPFMSNGDWIDGAWLNQYLRDNFKQLWKIQAAEDLIVGASPSTAKRLAKGANGTFLGVNSSGQLAYSYIGVVTAQKADTTGHSYSSSTWRNMPNSSATIVLPAGPTYTVQVTGLVVNTAPTQNYGWRDYQVRINGVDVGVISSEIYQINEQVTTPIAGMATGVLAGTRTILIRERAELGEYEVSRLYWQAIATAEPA